LQAHGPEPEIKTLRKKLRNEGNDGKKTSIYVRTERKPRRENMKKRAVERRGRLNGWIRGGPVR